MNKNWEYWIRDSSSMTECWINRNIKKAKCKGLNTQLCEMSYEHQTYAFMISQGWHYTCNVNIVGEVK